jgi:nicotinamidase-related amidase
MLHPQCVCPEKTALCVIDIQEKFSAAIADFNAIAENAAKLITACRLLTMPVLVTEQYPRGLGKTVEAVAQCIGDARAMEKTSFSCTGASDFWPQLERCGADTVIVCGIETHVCVNQTVHALLHKGYSVHVILDAVGSRKSRDHETALRKMEHAGALPSTVELCLFELLGDANSKHFKEIQKLVK